MPHPEAYLRACNCANWQEAQRLIATGHPNEAILLAAWHALAKLAPPFEVQTEFCSPGVPKVPKIIWQRRFDKACAEQNNPTTQDPRPNSELLAAVANPSLPAEERIDAIYKLGASKHGPAILLLIETMNTEDRDLAFAAASALLRMDSKRHARRLIAYLRHNSPAAAKQAAIYTIQDLNERRGATSLARIALDCARESGETRLMATEALRNNIHKPFVQRILAEAINDADVGVRMSALCASNWSFDRPLLPVLRRALESRLDDPELIYDEPFGHHVRQRMERYEPTLRDDHD